ncbi:MAG: acyl-ACP--UDP-N-acetylglucosamine O-acyltransferase [Pseudomonadales bacterium]|nr:acyl-ACP--UDP-N-acetylglucosamine O-acyltransferase [Pseudomonadales bacterium]
MIDPRAIIDPSAKLGSNVHVGPWSWIGPGVEIGDDCHIASHVVLKGPTRMGRGNRIFQFSSIGEDTPALAYGGEQTLLRIGDNNTFREGVTVHRGMVQGAGETVIGSNCLFMAYVHIGHDCVLGDHVIMANNAAVSGHCRVGDYANFGGYAGVPQFRNVGAHTHIAGMSLVLKDVPAYMTVMGNPASAIGLNIEGMKRRGYAKEVVAELKRAHRVVYRQARTVKEAIAELEPVAARVPEVELFLASIRDSRWGIVRPRRSEGPQGDPQDSEE